MSLLNDIRKQSEETREIMFYLSILITVLLIGMIWFRSFQKNLYVLMNPEGDVEKALAVQNTSVPSLFGFIGSSANEIKGLVSDFLGKEEETNDNIQNINKGSGETDKVYTLPLSEYK